MASVKTLFCFLNLSTSIFNDSSNTIGIWGLAFEGRVKRSRLVNFVPNLLLDVIRQDYQDFSFKLCITRSFMKTFCLC